MTRALRRAPVLLAALLGLLALPGCLTLRETLVLEPDGSGRIQLEHDFDPAAWRALLARVRAHLLPGVGGGEPDARVNPVAPGWLQAAAKEGKDYRLAHVESLALEGGRTRVRAEGLFPSLESAAKGGAFHGGDVRLERAPKGGWRFTLRDPWTPVGPGSSDVFGGIEAALVRSVFAEDLKALSRTLTITFPGPVRATNGALSEDRRTVTWTSKADAAPPDGTPPAALSAEFVLPAEAAWPTFHQRPDLGALARRCLLPPPAPPAPPRKE